MLFFQVLTRLRKQLYLLFFRAGKGTGCTYVGWKASAPLLGRAHPAFIDGIDKITGMEKNG